MLDAVMGGAVEALVGVLLQALVIAPVMARRSAVKRQEKEVAWLMTAPRISTSFVLSGDGDTGASLL